MELSDILTLKRPSHRAQDWLDKATRWLPPDAIPHQDEDGDIMALSVQIGGNPATLYCCHLDTVHDTAGRQTLATGNAPGHLITPDGECLGADDGAGIWLLLQMIRAAVPGTYLFHLGEESGCIGSRWLAANQSSWLRHYHHAISFDRPGVSDVITHFLGRRGCSPQFAQWLSDGLNPALKDYTLSPSSRGGSTDVCQYIGLIPEVTNISIGYRHQHTPDESLDLNYLLTLRDAIIRLGFSPRLQEGEPSEATLCHA